MSAMAIERPSKAQAVVGELRDMLGRRLATGALGACPVEFASAFVGLAASQSCGKCTPCRIGLAQLKRLIDQVLDGKATAAAIDTIARLARDAYLSADCAIGYEAAAAALKAVESFRADFESHAAGKGCSFEPVGIPCTEGCPAHVDVPGYVALVNAGRYTDAVRLIRKDNPFALACGLICEHPCEKGCRRAILDDAVNIRALKRYAVEHAEDYEPAKYEATGKKVAVIGGGPAGLTAAYYLALMGHGPTVFEARAHLGGMMRYGIPAYRLPREQLQGEIDWLCRAGIEVRLNTSVPEDVTLDELREQYDAVVIAIGAHTDKKLGVDGEGAQGVLSAVGLLRAIGDGFAPSMAGENVIVVGGGNVAMDCARSAVRLGARHVSIVYRRRIDDMTCLREEIDGAMAEGCELVELAAPVSVVAENDQVKGLLVQPQMIGEVDRGRPRPVAANAPAQVLPADRIVVAIGQNVVTEPFEAAGVPGKRGTLPGGVFGQVAGMPGVFVGGDCETGPATVVRAVAAGKALARNVDEYLGFDRLIMCEVDDIPSAPAADKPKCGRAKCAERPVCERADDFDLMETGLSPEEAAQDSSRCLRCDQFGPGVFRAGRSLAW